MEKNKEHLNGSCTPSRQVSYGSQGFPKHKTKRMTSKEEAYISLPNLTYHFEDPQSQLDRENELESQENEPWKTWLLLVNIFLFYVIYGYHYMAFGIYYVKWTSAFDTSKAASGFVGAIHQFVNSLCGICAPVILEKIGPKWTGILGTCVVVSGVLGSSFVTSVYMLFVTYGVLAGFGCAITGLPAAVLIQTHFTKHRTMATSISVVGLPTGNLIAPTVTNYFIQWFGWRGALMLHAGILLNSFVLIQMWPSENRQNSVDETVQSSSICKRIFDVSLLKEYLPMMYIIAGLIYRFALITLIEHTPSRAVYIGSDLQQAAFLMTVFGCGSVITRSLCSFIMPLKCSNPIAIYAAVMMTQGTCAYIVTVASTYRQVLATMFLIGLAQGFVVPSSLLSMVKLTSVSRFARMLTLANFMGGITALLSTPVSGRLFDVTQNYNIPFYVASCFAITASICLFAVYVLHKVKEKKELIHINADVHIEEQHRTFEQGFLKQKQIRERKFTM